MVMVLFMPLAFTYEDTFEEWVYGRSNVYLKNGFVCQVKYK